MFDSITLAREDLAIDVEHDDRHELRDVPFARESIPYIVHLPDEGIALFTYTWVNKDHEAGAAIAIFGPGVGDEPIQVGIPDQPIPPGMKFDNWQLHGLAIQQDNRFSHAQIQFENEDVRLEMEFAASHPPYAYGSNPKGCPPFMADNRIEQGGRMWGLLHIHGRDIPFDTTGHRDHSWGVRDWNSVLHYNWFQGQAGPDTCVHFWHMHALGWTRNWGYVFKDGLLAEVVDVDVETDFDENFLQKQSKAKLTDEAGRITEIESDFYAWYTLVPDPGVALNEGAARTTIDGKDGLGWMEVTWPMGYLEHIRANGPY